MEPRPVETIVGFGHHTTQLAGVAARVAGPGTRPRALQIGLRNRIPSGLLPFVMESGATAPEQCCGEKKNQERNRKGQSCLQWFFGSKTLKAALADAV